MFNHPTNLSLIFSSCCLCHKAKPSLDANMDNNVGI